MTAKPTTKPEPRTKEEVLTALTAFTTAKGWSEKRLASYVKTTPETAKKWLNGETRPNPKIEKWLFRNRKPVVEEVPAEAQA